ncbi:hypothetical protein DFH09DRAFT_1107541 [Mycena vulgaris]|nr:hypothetical protein DFH09DRAFT_1107541 [Mycena vulgaris]
MNTQTVAVLGDDGVGKAARAVKVLGTAPCICPTNTAEFTLNCFVVCRRHLMHLIRVLGPNGTYMDFYGGDTKNGADVLGYPAAEGDKPGLNQEWEFIRFGVFDSIREPRWRRSKTVDGTRIEGWENEEGTADQGWNLNRVSATHDEIIAALQRSPYRLSDFKQYPVDSMYASPKTWDFNADLSSIWTLSGLRAEYRREQIFDCDDFALSFKAYVAKWGNENIKADNFTLLCGLMIGQSVVTGKDGKSTYHASNWTLTDNRTTVLFFEPQNGQISSFIKTSDRVFGYYSLNHPFERAHSERNDDQFRIVSTKLSGWVDPHRKVAEIAAR